MSEQFYGFDMSSTEEPDFQIVTSSRGGSKLIHEGYIYYVDKKKQNTGYWECVQRRGNQCRGRVMMKVDPSGKNSIVITASHNHKPGALKTETAKYRDALKRKSKEGTERPEKLIRLCAAAHPIEVQTTISKQAQRKICQRQRNPEYLPKDPDNYDSIHETYTKTIDGHPFLLKNIQLDDGRIMIFASVQNLQRLSLSEVWILDGTFSTAPNGFRQIFTIHGSLGNGLTRKFVPFVHMLLTDKSERTYTKALQLLERVASDNGLQLDPAIVLTDFELAEINAIQTVFPDSSQYGCYFHLVQNMWKRMQKLHLTGHYSSNVNVEMAFRQTEALAFLKPEDVPAGFNAVRSMSPALMQPFFQYIENIYVSGKIKRTNENGSVRRSKPRHPPAFWSTEQNTLDNIPRTSNAIEGYHNNFNSLLKGVGDNKFYAVLRAFQNEERNTSGLFLKFLQGDTLMKSSHKLIVKEEKLKNAIVSHRQNRIPLFNHIQGLALILQNK